MLPRFVESFSELPHILTINDMFKFAKKQVVTAKTS